MAPQLGLELIADRVLYGGSRPDGVDYLSGMRIRFLRGYLAGTGSDRGDRERGYAVCAIRGPGERTVN